MTPHSNYCIANYFSCCKLSPCYKYFINFYFCVLVKLSQDLYCRRNFMEQIFSCVDKNKKSFAI